MHVDQDAEFSGRHERIRERMRSEGLDAVIAYSNAKFQGCVQYLANYSVRFVAANTLPDGRYTAVGSCAALFPAEGDEATLLVDQRWDEARAHEVAVLPETRLSTNFGIDLARLTSERGYRRVGIDNWFIFPAPHYLELTERTPDGVEFVPTQLIERVYQVKTPAEIELIRRAEQVGVRALEAAYEAVDVGATDFEIGLAADHEMRRHGDLELAGGMVVAAGAQTAVGSGLPSRESPYTMQRGDWVMIDICPQYEGYAGDICRMFVAGRVEDVDDARLRLYRATEAMLEVVLGQIRPGVIPRTLNEVAQEVADDHGVGEHKTTTLGHGVGIDLHDVPDFRWDEEPLQPGVCITIEPCLMAPGVGGTRIEELVAVTEDGCEVLSAGIGTELRGSE